MNERNKFGMVLAGLSLGLLVLFGAAFGQEQRMQKEISREILRCHVLANSDSMADQEEKMQVKDAVANYLRPLLQNTESKEDAVECVKKHLYNIEETAQKIAASKEVTVSLEKDYFPEITYGDCTFPEGTYDALKIKIGEAKGHNWWCVLYPNLCFSGAIKPVVTEDDKSLLKNVLDEDCYCFLLRPAKTKIRFRLFGLEFFGQNR